MALPYNGRDNASTKHISSFIRNLYQMPGEVTYVLSDVSDLYSRHAAYHSVVHYN